MADLVARESTVDMLQDTVTMSDPQRLSNFQPDKFAVNSSMSQVSTQVGSFTTHGDLTPTTPIIDEQQVLVLIDWDDTLFPTTWVTDQGMLATKEVTDLQRRQLCACAEAAMVLLEQATTLGDVVIITNAEEGWVQLSCLRFMPRLLPLLRRVPVVSARTQYEAMGIYCPAECKRLAFEREVTEFTRTLSNNQKVSLVAIGDSTHEHAALQRAADLVPGCSTKSLVFAEQPSPKQLYEQLGFVVKKIEQIALYARDTKINVASAI